MAFLPPIPCWSFAASLLPFSLWRCLPKTSAATDLLSQLYLALLVLVLLPDGYCLICCSPSSGLIAYSGCWSLRNVSSSALLLPYLEIVLRLLHHTSTTATAPVLSSQTLGTFAPRASYFSILGKSCCWFENSKVGGEVGWVSEASSHWETHLPCFGRCAICLHHHRCYTLWGTCSQSYLLR